VCPSVPSPNVVPANAGTPTPRPIVEGCCWTTSRNTKFCGYGSLRSQGRQNTHLRVPAARKARGFSKSLTLREQRARGKPGVRCTRSRAWGVVNTRVSHHRFTGSIRLSPRNGFNGFLRALPGDRAFLPPSSTNKSANLTPASGRQDHTTSPSASGALVSSTIRVHRIPHPTSVTTAKRPSYERGMARVLQMFLSA
jgi:hypothetical protein